MKEMHQKVSQFMDDELHPAELEGFLLNVKRNPEIVNKMTRYHLMSHGLKSNNDLIVGNNDFLDKIKQEIKQEPHYLIPKKRINNTVISSGWKKSSIAVAASISIMAIMFTQQVEIKNTDVLPIAQATIAANEQVNIPVPIELVATNATDSQHERLKAYLLAHSDDLYTHGSINAHPFAQVAGYNQD